MTKLFWTQKQDIGPSERFYFGMTFDEARLRVVLFGGEQKVGHVLVRDTWEWNGEFWTQTADMGPPARLGHAFAYDGLSADRLAEALTDAATNQKLRHDSEKIAAQLRDEDGVSRAVSEFHRAVEHYTPSI